MINRKALYLTVSIVAILILLSISSFAKESTELMVKFQETEQTVLPVISSDKTEIDQTEAIDPSQTPSEKELNLSKPVEPGTRAGEQINWQVISGGGTDGSSSHYNLLGTVGQTAAGEGTSASYILAHGYWQTSGSLGPCDCVSGEADGSTPISILDVVYIINFKYKEGPDPIPYALCSADAECDCDIDILDIVYLINFKYKEGPSPCACEVWVSNCGPLH